MVTPTPGNSTYLHTLSLRDSLPISGRRCTGRIGGHKQRCDVLRIFCPLQPELLPRLFGTLRCLYCLRVDDPLRRPKRGVVRVVNPEQLALILARIGHAHERRGQRNAMLRIKRLPVEAEKVVQRIVRDVIAVIITECEEGMIVEDRKRTRLNSSHYYDNRMPSSTLK